MTTYNDDLSSYIAETFAREDEVLRTIRSQVRARGLPNIMISPEEGAFLRLLVAASGATRGLEIGTLGGYSGVWIGRGLAPGGTLTTIELDPAHAAVARDHFQLASLDIGIEVMEGSALEILPGLAEEDPFDFIFIDADRENMLEYLDWSRSNLAPGGVLCAHNAFAFGGQVVDRSIREASVINVREFNQHIAMDPDFIATIFPAGDGVLAAFRRQEADSTG